MEERLIQRGASLTYDASEARLVLGKVRHRKRAALELRAHGVWTEEIESSEEAGPPAEKRRRVDRSPPAASDRTGAEGDGDGDDANDDGVSVTSTAPSTLSSDGTVDTIQVIRLEWLDKSIASGRILPANPFIVYEGRITERPQQEPESHDHGRPTIPPVAAGSEILRRAKADAVTQPAHTYHHHHHHHHQAPSKLRRTTSEDDENIPMPSTPDWVRDNVSFACMRSAPSHPPNEKFMDQLDKIRTIRELTLDEVGVRAYGTAIAAIAAYPYKLRRREEVISLPGCSAKFAYLFAEFKDSPDGTIADANKLDTDPALKMLNTFYHIWGVGAHKAREFYYTRGFHDLDDIVERGWDDLSRVQQIGIKYYDEFMEGISRSETECIAGIVKKHANRVRSLKSNDDGDGGGVECVIVGGYRRGKEVSGDVDLILSHRDESVTKNLVVDVVTSLENENWITHTLSLHTSASSREQQTRPFKAGSTRERQEFDSLDKALVVWQDPHFDRDKNKRNPNPHRRVDIIISPWRTVGCAILGWTGGQIFERDLRRVAKTKRWKFDSSGVRQRSNRGQVVDLEASGKTWQERERLVMEGLGVGYRDPSLRCSR